MLQHIYISDENGPVTGLSLTWEYLITGTNGTDKSGSAPSITEVGAGFYKYDIDFGTAPWDVTTEDLLGVIDASSSVDNIDRFLPVKISIKDYALNRFVGLRKWDWDDGTEHIFDIDLSTEELTMVRSQDTTNEQDVLTPTAV